MKRSFDYKGSVLSRGICCCQGWNYPVSLSECFSRSKMVGRANRPLRGQPAVFETLPYLYYTCHYTHTVLRLAHFPSMVCRLPTRKKQDVENNLHREKVRSTLFDNLMSFRSRVANVLSGHSLTLKNKTNELKAWQGHTRLCGVVALSTSPHHHAVMISQSKSRRLK